MSLRRQLPAYSPIALAGLLSRPDPQHTLEAMLRDAYGATDVLLVDSGTSALTLAIRMASERTGGAVALPAYGCYDLATAAVGSGCRIVLYDVDPRTLGPERSSLERAAEAGVGAVVLAYLYGVPVDLAVVESATAPAGALVIEDAAQGVGGTWRGTPLGGCGAIGVLSFGRGKGRTAGGGGAVVVRDAEGRDALRAVRRRLGPARWGAREAAGLLVQRLLGRPSLYGIPASLPFLGLGETVYREPTPPAGFPVLGRSMLPDALRRSAAEERVRRAHAARLAAAVMAAPNATGIEVPEGGEAGYLRLPLLLGPVPDRREHLRRGRGLGVMPGYPEPLVRLPALASVWRHPVDVDFPGADRLAADLVTLPTHSLLTEDDMVAIERWLATACASPCPQRRRPVPW